MPNLHFAILYIVLGGVQIVTYSSVFKFWFTFRASARAEAPETPVSFNPRLCINENN